MMRYRLLLLLILTLFFLTVPAPDSGAEQGAQTGAEKSAQIQQALEKKQLEAQIVVQKEMKVLGELERLDRQMEEEQEAVKHIARRLNLSQDKSRRLDGEIEKISHRMEQRKELFTRRLAAVYKLTRVGTMAALFSAESFPELLMRHKYLVMAARFDADLIGGYQKDLLRLEEQKRAKSREIQLQEHLKQETEKRLQSLNAAKEQKQKVLHMARIEKAAHMQAVAELEKAHQELSRMIASFRPSEEPHAPAPGVSHVREESGALKKGPPKLITDFKGKLIPPVNGKVIERFGSKRHPKFNTITFQKGIDIAASEGSETLSIFNGRVLYSGWFPGYGKMIIIDHGKSYYSVYAHLSMLFKKVGDTAAEGEPIGLVGDTGSLKGPCLYFEIRHHGVPQDPMEWIRI